MEPAECKDKLPAKVGTTEKPTEAPSSCSSSLPDAKCFMKPFSRKGSEAGSVADCADNQSVSPPTVFNTPAAPLETRNEKRVRKLKKRKVLKKAQGTEQPESSDSEMVEETARPRWLRQRRRPSGGSQVSTSSQPTDDREMSVNTDDNKKVLSFPLQAINLKEDQRSPELQAPLTDPAGNADLKESMEVAACQQHPMDSLLPPGPSGLIPDPSRPGPQSLACNEVSSTSDMDLCKSER